jgi:hypothetical protein
MKQDEEREIDEKQVSSSHETLSLEKNSSGLHDHVANFKHRKILTLESLAMTLAFFFFVLKTDLNGAELLLEI